MTKTTKTAIIEPLFAKRLEIAADNHDLLPPYNFGRLAWIADKMKADHGVTVSRETVRKWFHGESRPRPDKMKALAAVMRVSESWLALGTKAEPSPEEMKRRSVTAESAVNLVAGIFGMNGASYAFPEEDDPKADHVHFYAILRGRQNSVYVSTAQETKDGFRFNVSNKFESLLTIGVVQRSVTQFDLYSLTPSVISKYGTKRGSHVELTVKDSGAVLTVQGQKLPRIESLESLRREPVAA